MAVLTVFPEILDRVVDLLVGHHARDQRGRAKEVRQATHPCQAWATPQRLHERDLTSCQLCCFVLKVYILLTWRFSYVIFENIVNMWMSGVVIM